MAVSIDHLERVGRTFARSWDNRDVDVLRPLYHEDAVFISPNPPSFSVDFGTTLNGRHEILRYFQAVMDVIPAGEMTTVALLTGIDMVVWVWESGHVKGADIMMLDGDGLIVRHHVTSPEPD
jgi:ketosteroid isomerase-like protein